MNASFPTPPATVLVTGIGGFLAGHIAAQLLQQGYRVRGSLRTMSRSAAIESRLLAAAGSKGKPIASGIEFVQADLLDDKGWDVAMAGCDYVMHTASPFPSSVPKDENEIIRPAREGAVRVLRTAHKAGVKRVVLTSSIAAINYGHGRPLTSEADWTDVTSRQATPYYKSKTLAELDAWAYARKTGLELAVINPGMILGPLLSAEAGTSVDVIRKLLAGEFPALPHFGISLVDVRDVADAHLRAMTHSDAAGQRFIAGGRFMWMSEISAVLRESFPGYARKLPRMVVPNWLVRVLARFDPTMKLIVEELGVKTIVSSVKARQGLGWNTRSEEEAICASAQSLIDFGLVKAV